jgi:hypothetical protein
MELVRMIEKVIARLKQDVEEMAGHMVSVKREDLEMLLVAYEELKATNKNAHTKCSN